MVFKYDHNENINTPSKSVFLNRRATAGCRVPGAGCRVPGPGINYTGPREA